MTHEIFDIFVIGGGVNGCGIARDAAGRGLSVSLAEQSDLAQATSSSSSKLFHGGLRYLEYYEFRLVKEALRERETLLRAMPHISWPMRFILPHQKGLRPRWLLRLGLFLYDYLGGRKILPPSRSVNFATDPSGKPLKPVFTHGFEYSDCWIQDARLVALNARDAADRGAQIMTRVKVTNATRHTDHWEITLVDQNTGDEFVQRARTLVNAAGPWIDKVLNTTIGVETGESIRLVRGSHIVTKRLFDHDKPYIFQGGDGRIVFAIPYENDFTLIGTTEADHEGPIGNAECSDEEADYLCRFVSDYFDKPVTQADIVWKYAGVRPLYEDGASSATAATRDYVLSLETNGAPVLNIFGGKITTYRKLAQAALNKLGHDGGWTAGAPLPGGEFPWDRGREQVVRLAADFPFLTDHWANRLIYTYGTKSWDILDGSNTADDLGQHFGANLYQKEVQWMMDREFAQTGEDVLWRRTKLGLFMNKDEQGKLTEWMETARAG